MPTKKVLETLKNTYCRIMPSSIEGVGIFAIREIPKGTNPFFNAPKQKWLNINVEEFDAFDPEIKKMISDFFAPNEDGTFSIPECGLNGIDMSFFLNCSESPNVKTIDGGTNFETLRKIEKNEELTVAYSDYDERWNKNKFKNNIENKLLCPTEQTVRAMQTAKRP